MDKLAPTPYKEVWGLADPHSLNEATNPLATFSDDPKGLMGLQPRGTRVTVGQYGQEARVSLGGYLPNDDIFFKLFIFFISFLWCLASILKFRNCGNV